MTKETGGPAFPIYHGGNFRPQEDGMTLRDYFAAKAMQALLSDGDWRADMLPKDTAHISYVVADAMLKAREQ